MLIFNYSKQKEAFSFPPAPTCKLSSEQIHFWRGTKIWLFCRWKIHISLSSSVSPFEPSSRPDGNMSPLKSKAAKEFGTPRPSLPPPERKGHPGELYFFHSKNFFHVLFWHRHIHIPTSQARALLWWRSSAPSRWSASTRPGRASSSSTSPLRWSVCQSLTIILQVCFSLRSSSASSPSWSSWTIGE